MRLAIIDPGYAHRHAHHHSVNSSVNSAFSVHGVDVVVLAAKEIDTSTISKCLADDINVLPYFTTPCYPPNANALPKRQHDVLSEMFAKEIVELFKSGFLLGDEVLLLHTAFSFHISGLARALWYLTNRFHGQLLISMMFHPGARLVNENNAASTLECFDAREYLRHKMAFRTLHAAGARCGVGIKLAAPCRTYQSVYQTLWPKDEVAIHPAVGYRPLAAQLSSRTPERLRTLLYLGGVKADKGIEFAARFGAAAALAHPTVEFVFHFNEEFSGANNFAFLIEDLKSAGEAYRNVTVLSGNLSEERYDNLLESCQIICLLYDPAEYVFKTSGVFWDALRCPNVAWLVSGGTWPAMELEQLGIPHEKVAYGDVSRGCEKFAALMRRFNNKAFEGPGVSTIDHDYLQFLNSSFGQWVFEQYNSLAARRNTGVAKRVNPDYQHNRARVLVVRTHYGHFSPFSGPGGFVPHLRSFGYVVDEWMVSLGASDFAKVPLSIQDQFNQLVCGYLKSYQGNAVVTETTILREMHRYDLVHFVDGEHCGLLCALFKLRVQLNHAVPLIATFHQPETIMREIVANPEFLNGFDRIHLMSPCQVKYFEPIVGVDRLAVVPHGIAPQLFGEKLPVTIVGPNAKTTIPGFDDVVCGKQILLTVGNWLRDFDGLLATAKEMQKQADVIFVIVSKGLTLAPQQLPNVHLLNEGVSDSQLHALYRRATLLFLPLQDGAANNAILEAMAHGLPIVTTDLPSTRFYTNELATLVHPSPVNYAAAILNKLRDLGITNTRQQNSAALRSRAQSLTWQKIAKSMHENLYAPLLNKRS
jgi:glycosyltransferase involved in cell wall biosynthesis